MSAGEDLSGVNWMLGAESILSASMIGLMSRAAAHTRCGDWKTQRDARIESAMVRKIDCGFTLGVIVPLLLLLVCDV